MKKSLFAVLIIALAVTACKQASAPVVNVEAEKAAIDSVFMMFDSAFQAQDVEALASYVSEDALCLGTDPSEFLSKQQIKEMWVQMFADSAPAINYISKREIRVDAGGKSANVVDQYTMPIVGPKILWRNAYHLNKVNDKWMIDFLNCSFILKNEDILKLNQALE